MILVYKLLSYVILNCQRWYRFIDVRGNLYHHLHLHLDIRPRLQVTIPKHIWGRPGQTQMVGQRCKSVFCVDRRSSLESGGFWGYLHSVIDDFLYQKTTFSFASYHVFLGNGDVYLRFFCLSFRVSLLFFLGLLKLCSSVVGARVSWFLLRMPLVQPSVVYGLLMAAVVLTCGPSWEVPLTLDGKGGHLPVDSLGSGIIWQSIRVVCGPRVRIHYQKFPKF